MSPRLDDPANNASLPAPQDPFANLDALRLSQDFAKSAAVKVVITTVDRRKPHRHEFVRVHPGEDWQFQTVTFTDKLDRETYLVAPDLLAQLPGDCRPTVLFTAMGRRSRVPFLWPCFLPGADGRSNRWHESALEAARQAQRHWVRVEADMDAGCYVSVVAQADLGEAPWPEEMSFEQLIRLAFKDRFIQSLDHPVLQRLRGEV